MTDLFLRDVASVIAETATRLSNWGRWGPQDAHGTLNFITDEKRLEGARCVRRGKVFSLAFPFDVDGPQNGWRGRVNPIRTMITDGLDAARGIQGLPHGFGGADDCVFMPLQCGTQWDGLGHIFDHGTAWNDRPSEEAVTSQGDQVTGMERNADRPISRGVLLDAGRVLGEDGVLPDGFAISSAHLDEIVAAQGESSRVGTGDIVLVRTGQLGVALRDGWGTYAGGDAPGLSFESLDWIHNKEIAAAATDTWGLEVRPNEFAGSFQPMHQVMIPHIGLWVGEMWALDDLAADCAADGVYDFLLVAPPLPFTGAVGSPLNPVAMK